MKRRQDTIAILLRDYKKYLQSLTSLQLKRLLEEVDIIREVGV